MIEIKSLTLKASMQAAFNKACAGVLAQGCRAFSGGACKYRITLSIGEEGRKLCLKCAIGHLLTDEQIEKYAVNDNHLPHSFHPDLLNELLPGYKQFSPQNKGEAVDFLHNLQHAHDKCHSSYPLAYENPKLNFQDFNSEFTFKANEVAKLYGLTPITSTPSSIPG